MQSHHEADYDAILNTVMDSQRGRWFLNSFAQRLRQAETRQILTSIEKLERGIAQSRDLPGIQEFRTGLMDMASAIARTRSEIAAIRSDATIDSKLTVASSELDGIVQQTETATADILHAAECIQEVAWILREQGADPGSCDVIDHQSTEIYTACSFQDLTAQRTRKVIGTLEFLETRINAMIDIWRIEADQPASMPDTDPAFVPPEAMSQLDIDMVLAATPPSRLLAQAIAIDEMLATDKPAPSTGGLADGIPDRLATNLTNLDSLSTAEKLRAFS